jgi:SOS-response transcriptional repressor LexA
MDITSYELKTMKVKQLKKLIREAIEQVLNEDPAKSKNLHIQAAKFDQQSATLRKQAAEEEIRDAQQDAQAATNEDLNEMASKVGNKLSDENMDLSPFANQMLSGKSVKDILTYIKENPGATEKQIADAFNFARQQPINALMKVLRDKGIIVRLDNVGGQVITPKAPGEEGEEDEDPVTGGHELFIGKGNPLAWYLNNEPNIDGSEDSSPEPEKATYASPVTAMSKAAEFTTDNSRLIDKIINAQAASKLRVKEAVGDEGGLSSKDVTVADKKRKETATSNLPELISQLAEKIQAEDKDVQDAILSILAKKFASVGYTSLTKKIAAAVGANVPQSAPQVQEPEIDDLGSEEEEPEPLDEYAIRKLQFYAGIIK